MSDELWDLLTEEQKNMFSIVGSQTLILKNSEKRIRSNRVVSGEGVGTLRAASEENTRVIISREYHESRKILLYAFGAICVSEKPRTLHADVPTFSLLIAHNSLPKNLFLMFFCLIQKLTAHCS